MRFLRIVGLGLLAAIGYGIVHDQLTIRISPEYFTIGHPPLVPSESLTLIALGWGIAATWWVGLPLGLLLAITARAGRRRKLTAEDLRRPVGILLLGMAACAALAAAVGSILAVSGSVWLVPPMAYDVPSDRHVAFLTALWAHNASYAAGIIGGLALAVATWRRRAESARLSNETLQQTRRLRIARFARFMTSPRS